MGLSETRRPDSSEMRTTYHWSGMSDGTHCRAVTVSISCRLQPLVGENTLVY